MVAVVIISEVAHHPEVEQRLVHAATIEAV